ncbi:MAG: aldose epimerase family protein [Rikenellaceae bacterium]
MKDSDMKSTKIFLGVVDGEDIYRYTLLNDNGIEIHVINYGVTITSILLPAKDGKKDNIVCGFNTLESYLTEEYRNNAPYFGAVIGRYCATIAPGSYEGNELTKNAGENTLHGGIKGFDKRVWKAEQIGNQSIEFSLRSEDGDQGFLGKVDACVTLTINNNNELIFHYEAVSDKRTPLSMTNHTYYNLSGFEEDVLNHNVKIESTQTFAMDAKGNYVDNCKDVDGLATDLRESTQIATLHENLGSGAEHFYLFEGGLVETARKVAEISLPSKERKLEVFTTEPGMLLYTAKYTSNNLCRESGEQFGQYRAFCCETHRVPNGPNLEGASDVFIDENKKFDSKTIFKFTF